VSAIRDCKAELNESRKADDLMANGASRPRLHQHSNNEIDSTHSPAPVAAPATHCRISCTNRELTFAAIASRSTSTTKKSAERKKKLW